jgi:hypothetical protein
VDLDMSRLAGIRAAWGSAEISYAAVADASGIIFERRAEGWSSVTPPGVDIARMAGAPDGTVWAVGEGTLLVRTEDGWAPRDAVRGAAPVALDVEHADSADIVFSESGCEGCGNMERAALFHWDGASWTEHEDPVLWSRAPTDAARLLDGRLFVIGPTNARVFDGAEWRAVAIDGADADLRHVAVLPNGGIVAAGDAGMFAAGTPEEGLFAQPTERSDDFVDVHVTSEGEVLVLGDGEDGRQLLLWEGPSFTPLGEPDGWVVLADGPGGGLVAGGIDTVGRGLSIGEGDTRSGLAPTLVIEAVLPIRDLATASDGTVYSAPGGDGPVGMSDGAAWRSLPIGDDDVRTIVAAGDVLALTDASILRWDGAVAVPEPFVLSPGESVRGLDTVSASAELAVAIGTLVDAEGRGGRTLFVRSEQSWSPLDLGPLPLPTLHDATVTDATVWLALGDFASDTGALLSWSAATGTVVHDDGIAGEVKAVWPRADGGVWAWIGGRASRGLSSYDGATFVSVLGDEIYDVWDVVDHPALGPIVSAEYGSVDAALLLRDETGAWTEVVRTSDPYPALALRNDGTVVAGTDWGVTTLACAIAP